MAHSYLPPVDRAVLPAQSREHIERPAGIKGGFRVSLTTLQWWWSPGMFQLHGYHPDDSVGIRPTTRLLLSHRHPADRRAVAQAWSHLLADGGMVAFRYRIVGVDGRVRPVFVMLSTDVGPGGRAHEVTGVMQSDGPVG